MIQYIRYYHHDLFPEYSGIATYDGAVWKKEYQRFDRDDLEFLTVCHPKAEVQCGPISVDSKAVKQ